MRSYADASFITFRSPTVSDSARSWRSSLPSNGVFTAEMADHAIEHFEEIRSLNLRKPPATAELLAWLSILQAEEIDVANPGPGDRETIALTYSVLAKSRQDLSLLREQMTG